ncbi:OLC1v1018092C1 [Oldenlandia corymbosa var. corymbosa]|uniref:OLC1v1018092C1 n=1 Tax=Oldenlandia corymbosa var. corymbosa TaxID=529605 RepID=A0AAV1EB59_OLDCO|nr:OLC1v1018092C1 [Oldenlandia corymbosa var. corymbosa]
MSCQWPLLMLVLLFSLPIICQSSSLTITADLFEDWCKQYGKTYSSEQEKQFRFKVFEDNYDYVTKHNSMPNSTYTLSLNAFADLTHQEFRAAYLGLSVSANDSIIRLNNRESTSDGLHDGDIPSSIDWRKKGAVTKVKDQGNCGACWAFSATGAMEGINKIVSGSLVSLSEQELIDCDKSYNNGCDGGLMDYAFQFVKKNHGIDTEDDYPYQGRSRTCNSNKLKRRVVTIDGYQDVDPRNEKKLLKAVAKQPVSVGICGSERGFQLYSRGIFTGPCSIELDHAVLIVGYDSEDGVDYWIVKNSWGTSWGINGYIHMARNSGDANGICGINLLPSYPLKTSPNPPPSPPPGPTKCDLISSCPEGQTCCCSWSLFGLCLSWRCCDLNSAVCCNDHHHCCPHDYPICDTQNKLCLKKAGNFTMVKQLQNGGMSGKFGGWSSVFVNWNF